MFEKSKLWTLIGETPLNKFYHSLRNGDDDVYNGISIPSKKRMLEDLGYPRVLMGKQIHSKRITLVENLNPSGVETQAVRIWEYEGFWDDQIPEVLPVEWEYLKTLYFTTKGIGFSIFVRKSYDWTLPTEGCITVLPGEMDGILSGIPFLGTGVSVADCFPLFLSVENESVLTSGICGTLHSGWSGTGILAVAVTALENQFNILPEKITTIIGPGICSKCYRVDEKRGELVKKRFGDQWILEVEGRGRYRGMVQFSLDLVGMNATIAQSLGISDFFVKSSCTLENYHTHWSHRAYTQDLIKNDGRMLAVSTWKENV